MTEPLRYTIVIDESPGNYAASVPDLSDGLATGLSEAEAVCETHKAIRFHIESLSEHHQPVPGPRAAAAVAALLVATG